MLERPLLPLKTQHWSKSEVQHKAKLKKLGITLLFINAHKQRRLGPLKHCQAMEARSLLGSFLIYNFLQMPILTLLFQMWVRKRALTISLEQFFDNH